MIGLENSAKKVKRVNLKSRVKVAVDDSESNNEDVDDDAQASESDDDENSGSGDDAGSEGSASTDKKSTSAANPGWADAMQKILNTNKPKRKKTIVLSKAKKISEVKLKPKSETVPFEIQNEAGERTKEVITKIEKAEADGDDVTPKKRRKETQLGIRVKPSILDRERERSLQKIATKGVVQLFNVVKQQQTEIDKKLTEAGPLERKREKVLKSIDKQGFLDVLMGGSKNVPVTNKPKTEVATKKEDDKSEKVWSVLRDDFVMGAKLKDWDKKAPNDDEDGDSSSAEEMDSD